VVKTDWSLLKALVRWVALLKVLIVYRQMFSHIVIFWTDPSRPDAPDELIAAAKKYLESIPGIVHFHVGKMASSHRDVVDQTYQVALNIQFQSKQAQDEYQEHPQHLEFVKQCKPLFAKLVIYDFE
jgi:Stress responsive A/B Barrel Domain